MVTRYKSDPTAAVILLTILAAIIFYLFSVPEITRQEVLGDVSSYNATWFSASPGNLTGEAVEKDVKEISFPTKRISYLEVVDSALVSNQFSIFASTFSSKSETLPFDLEDPENPDTKIAFIITNKQGNGVLTINVNGRDIYAAEPGLGEQLSLSVPRGVLADSNNMTFTTEGTGFKFWAKNEYLITNANIETTKFSSEDATVDYIFSLTSAEMSNAESVELQFFPSPRAASTLKVELNGNILFDGIPTPNAFSLEVPTEYLNSGQNLLVYTVGEGGDYDISFAELIIETETVEGGSNYFFTIGSLDWKRVQSKAFTCELLVQKTSGPDEITVQINNNAREHSFSGGEVRSDVCNQLNEGSNKLTLSSDEDIDLQYISIGIRP